MKYEKVAEGRFISRPNRFVACVDIDGHETVCHVKNTGRCRELLIPGAEVWLSDERTKPGRKTGYDLVCVRKGSLMINMDSQAPNAAVGEWLRAGNLFPPGSSIRAETVYGDSRFDFSAVDDTGRLHLLEVKGVTLERDGIVLFPDAPTQRGVKHLRGLTRAAGDGVKCYVLFVVQMEGVRFFSPNEETDPEFAAALREAKLSGVEILAYDCLVTPESMEICSSVEIRL